MSTRARSRELASRIAVLASSMRRHGGAQAGMKGHGWGLQPAPVSKGRSRGVGAGVRGNEGQEQGHEVEEEQEEGRTSALVSRVGRATSSLHTRWFAHTIFYSRAAASSTNSPPLFQPTYGKGSGTTSQQSAVENIRRACGLSVARAPA